MHLSKSKISMFFLFLISLGNSAEHSHHSQSEMSAEHKASQKDLIELHNERKDLTTDQIEKKIDLINKMDHEAAIKEIAREFPKFAEKTLHENIEVLSRFGPYDPGKNFGYDYKRFLKESKDKDHSKMDYGIGIPADEGLSLEETLKREKERLEAEVKILKEALGK